MKFSANKTPFTASHLNFGSKPVAPEDEDTDGLPTPFKTKAMVRRQAGLKEATDILAGDNLPSPGEALHCVASHRMDMTDVVMALGEQLGECDRIAVATLGYNAENLRAMLLWIDTGATKQLTLLTSLYFRGFKGALWDETLREFAQRKQRAAACHSHAKVITLAFADGTRLSLEGSANLTGNGSGREQFCLVNDPALHDWHERWILDLVNVNEPKEAERKAKQRA
jgi:hypothetical protein